MPLMWKGDGPSIRERGAFSMTNRYIVCVTSLTIVNVFLLSAGWEFTLEELVEPSLWGAHIPGSSRDRWEHHLLATAFAALALITPIFLLLRTNAERRRVQEELTQKSILLEATLENMAQGFSVYDDELKLVGYNEHFGEMLGFPHGFLRPGITYEDITRYFTTIREASEDSCTACVRGNVKNDLTISQCNGRYTTLLPCVNLHARCRRRGSSMNPKYRQRHCH